MDSETVEKTLERIRKKQELDESIELLGLEIEKLCQMREQLEGENWPRKIKLYLHSDKGDNIWNWEEELEFPKPCPENFVYALSEVEFIANVDKDGNIDVLKVNIGNGQVLEKGGE